MKKTVILSKCSQSESDDQMFGIRLDKYENEWKMAWSFKTDEKRANREKFGRDHVKTIFSATSEYPGCPYCGSHSIFYCSCGKVMCYAGQKQITCKWCKQTCSPQDLVDPVNVDSGEF